MHRRKLKTVRFHFLPEPSWEKLQGLSGCAHSLQSKTPTEAILAAAHRNPTGLQSAVGQPARNEQPHASKAHCSPAWSSSQALTRVKTLKCRHCMDSV